MTRSRRLLLTVAAVVTMHIGSSLPAWADPGDVDDSFADLGLLTQPQVGTDPSAAITRGPGGRLVIAWSFGNAIRVSGYLGTGEVDGGFGTAGASSVDVPGADGASVMDSIVDGQGRIVVAGWAQFPTTTRMVVTRFTGTGDPDLSFSGDGVRTVSFTRGESYAYDVAVLDGKIFLVGQVYTGALPPADIPIVRLTGDGGLDPGFGVGGRRVYKVPDGFAGDDFGDAIKVVANGRLVVVGGVDSAQGGNSLMMRIHADGRPDTSFKGDGFHIMNLRKGGLDWALDVERDGTKLVLAIAGADADRPKIARLWADGSRDKTFSGDGVGTYPFGAPTFFRIRDVVVDRSHRVYAVGFSGGLPVFRVRTNGLLATGFGEGGLAKNLATSASAWQAMLRGDVLYVVGADGNDSMNATRYLV